ncbi:hypothetical protein FXO38_21768 [Capsicum annuum]|nr:hypothetical protein FXO38_21768 [Capsicum annuum]
MVRRPLLHNGSTDNDSVYVTRTPLASVLKDSVTLQLQLRYRLLGLLSLYTLRILGKDAAYDEIRILDAFQYVYRAHVLKWTTGHPVPSVASSKASSELNQIQKKKEIWFCGAYQGAIAAQGLLKRTYSVLNNPKHMVLTWPETEARLFVTRFLKSFIATGCIILLEEGGTMFAFEGIEKKCSLKVYLRVHSPQFHWKSEEKDLHRSGRFLIEKVSHQQTKYAQLRVQQAGLQPSDEASRPISPMDARRSCDDNGLNIIL